MMTQGFNGQRDALCFRCFFMVLGIWLVWLFDLWFSDLCNLVSLVRLNLFTGGVLSGPVYLV